MELTYFILLFVVAVVFLMLGMYGVKQRTSDKLYYHSQVFEDDIERIVKQIRKSGFRPDYIVGVVRGGAVPAVYLSNALGIPMYAIQWSTRDFGIKEQVYWLPEEINEGKKVLIVEDIIDSGESLRSLLADWKKTVKGKINTDNIKIATLYHNPFNACNINADYIGQVIDRRKDSRFVVFPWENIK